MKKVIFGLFTLISLSLPALSIAKIGDIEQKLTASDGAAINLFGLEVSISGDHAIIGAPFKNIGNSCEAGSAYIFERTSNGTWFEVATLKASDFDAYDYFGHSVSISGDHAIVGNRSVYGSVYFFERTTDGTWLEINKFSTSCKGNFGHSVSISGDRAIVGNPNYNSPNQASAHIFERTTDGTWLEVTKLNVSDFDDNDSFHLSVSISGDHAIVGNPSTIDHAGSAYIFERTEGNGDVDWNEITKLTASDGVEGDLFGSSVSISGDHAIIGAYGDDDNGDNSGSAYLFKHTIDGDWLELAKVIANDGKPGDDFGYSVSISGDHAIIGAYGDDDNGDNSGSAYLFKHTIDGDWLELTKVIANDGKPGDDFGYSVSISGDHAIIGAPTADDFGNSSGSAYIFSNNNEIPGDLDGNGTINLNDFYNVLLPAFRKCGDDVGYDPNCDFDSDECITVKDLLFFYYKYIHKRPINTLNNK